MSIDPKFVELTADVLESFFLITMIRNYDTLFIARHFCSFIILRQSVRHGNRKCPE